MNQLQICINSAIKKSKLSVLQAFLLSILAGMYIAFAGLTSTIGSFTVTNLSIAKVIAGLIFPLGIIIVVLANSELFTGNSLMIAGVLNKKISIINLLKNWIIVYIGNFIGSIAVTFTIVQSGLIKNHALLAKFTKIYDTKLGYSFSQCLFLGIICNILVCLAIWMAYNCQDNINKVLSLFFPVMAFVIIGAEHSVANMFFLTIGSWCKNLGYMNVHIFNNLIPVTLGNIIGGSLIGIIYYVVYRKELSN